MQATQYLLPIVLVLAFGGYAVWTMQRSKKAMAGFGPALHGFFQRSGYRYADMPPEPLESHVHRAMSDFGKYASGTWETRYVRSFHGLPVFYAQGAQTGNGSYSFWCRWSAPVREPPRVPFHIADKSLASFGKAVREAFSNTTRQWSPKFPQQVQTGIPQIDDRFVVFGFDPNAVRTMLQGNAALVGALLQCTEVDLWVDPKEAAYADPMQKNISAGLGGTVGQMAIGFDYAKRMDLSLPVHDRVAEVLAMAVRAAA